MKKHIIIFLCALALHQQTVFCMDLQSIDTEPCFSVAIEPCSIIESTQKQPDLKVRLLNKVTSIKNWIACHKKEILVGGMALAVVTAAALYYYTSQSAPLHASSIDTFNTVTPTPPSFLNTVANTLKPDNYLECSTPAGYLLTDRQSPTQAEQLLDFAEKCSLIPDHCWVDPRQRVSTEFFPYSLGGKVYDHAIIGCSHQDLKRLYDGYQACYDSVLSFADRYGLVSLKNKAQIALKQVKGYWDILDFYKVWKKSP